MSRNISLTAREAINAAETDETFLILLTLSHADLETPIRVTSDAVDTQSRGENFVAFPFSLSLPDTVEATFADFTFTDISYDSQTVEGDLSVEDFTAEPYPAASFSPSLFPGIF